jgi:small subunit ribosomal protein S4
MKLIATADSGEEDHVSREKADLITSLHRRGLLPAGASLDDVLRLNVDHVLARRLQSQVYFKGLAASPKQARQLLIHGHISIGDQVMTVPGYIVTREEEAVLQYSSFSELANEQHALRLEIESIRSQADYANDEEESTLELTNSRAPSSEEVQEMAEAAEAAPSSSDASGGES